jgi:hypothetical protein
MSREIMDTNSAFVNVAASQTNTVLVAAVPGSRIRVTNMFCVCSGTATTLIFSTYTGTAATAISATFNNAANGGAVLNYNPKGWFETAKSDSLVVTTGAGSTTGVQVGYVLI